MSIQVSAAVAAPRPPLSGLPVDPQADSGFEARWAAWILRGRQRELALRGKLRLALLVAVVVSVVAAVVYVLSAGAR